MIDRNASADLQLNLSRLEQKAHSPVLLSTFFPVV